MSGMKLSWSKTVYFLCGPGVPEAGLPGAGHFLRPLNEGDRAGLDKAGGSLMTPQGPKPGSGGGRSPPSAQTRVWGGAVPPKGPNHGLGGGSEPPKGPNGSLGGG